MNNKIDSNKKLKNFFNHEFQKLRETEPTISVKNSYFGIVGSTDVEDISYNKQLEVKLAALENIFTNVLSADIIKDFTIEPSPVIQEYRFRMDFVCSYDPFHEPNNRFGQRKKGKYNWVVDMHECNLVKNEWFIKTRKVYQKLQDLKVRNYDLVKKDGQLRYLVLREHEGQSMLNIVTAEMPNEPIETASKFALELGFNSVNWIVNNTERDESEGMLRKSFGDNTITIPLNFGDKSIKLQTGPLNFFQNNIYAFQMILNYIDQYLHSNNSTNNVLYDLYSGVGTLGIAFAGLFEQVIGFEINENSVKLSMQNAQLNTITNVKYLTQNLSIDTKLIDDEIVTHKNSTLIVDPPRTGLGKVGVEHVLKLKPKTLIYISCNPITQAEDLLSLSKNYQIIDAKAFDLFPHTYHMESVVIMTEL